MPLVPWAVAFAVGDALGAGGATGGRAAAALAILAVASLGVRRARALAGPATLRQSDPADRYLRDFVGAVIVTLAFGG